MSQQSATVGDVLSWRDLKDLPSGAATVGGGTGAACQPVTNYEFTNLRYVLRAQTPV